MITCFFSLTFAIIAILITMLSRSVNIFYKCHYILPGLFLVLIVLTIILDIVLIYNINSHFNSILVI